MDDWNYTDETVELISVGVNEYNKQLREPRSASGERAPESPDCTRRGPVVANGEHVIAEGNLGTASIDTGALKPFVSVVASNRV